jgi:hypothetical protein
MGYYIETGTLHGKAEVIAREHNGQIIPQPASFADVPDGMGLVCVVRNGMFDAAGFAYDEREFAVFADPGDYRAKTWVLLDYETAAKHSGYSARYPLTEGDGNGN